MSPVALARRLEPLRASLSQVLKLNVHLETTTNPQDFRHRTAIRRYDIVLTSPHFALMALDQGHYQLLAIQQQALRGDLIVMADSPIQTAAELSNKIIGVPPKSGFLGQITRSFFKQLGLTETRAPAVLFFHSHNDAFHALRMKNLDAAFIANIVTRHLKEKDIPIRVVASSDPYPGLTLLISRAVVPELHQRIQASVLALHHDPAGALALDQSSLSAFVPVSRDALESVRPFIPAGPN